MIYIINRVVKFKPADGTLWNIDDPEHVINLTITNSNLLQFILDSDGAILFREAILEDIWDKQGLSSSNNTLNQYISISRRAISLLGVEDDVIITVPRTGFRLNKYVVIEKESDSTPGDQEISSDKATGKRLINIKLLVFTLVLLIFFLLFYYFLHNDENSVAESFFYVGKYHVCDVYMIGSALREKNDIVLERASALIEEVSAACISGKVFITDLDFRGQGREFLAECTHGINSNENAFCKGYYIK
ncbi:winged helix-turn-helix domain-containing protein [Cedecea sp.]|jgi:DNA-binding winged helix-turn-helix (wHTH) protein|uniref:winged helix-turn-helix domain-containing protein n=1 Tax=Cedecea sp. TaxID=1970739 RepID=UPI0012AD63A4|nr:winged helix family transcriptional regulator [Enterobacteriaceae bacterium RIT693]